MLFPRECERITTLLNKTELNLWFFLNVTNFIFYNLNR